jgi:hypothetical protein
MPVPLMLAHFPLVACKALGTTDCGQLSERRGQQLARYLVGSIGQVIHGRETERKVGQDRTERIAWGAKSPTIWVTLLHGSPPSDLGRLVIGNVVPFIRLLMPGGPVVDLAWS